VTPYAGGPDFLAEPSARTLAVWDKLQPYFQEEIKKGVLDVDASTPATPTAFRPGSIDRDNEVIVGLQTEPAPAAIRRFSPTRTSSRRPTGRTWATP
jgi:formate C-acetyltransferase